MYDTILSPIDYGGMQLKNRIIFAPTTFGLSDEEYLAEMERLAKGGCAMIIIGDVPVAKSRFEKSLFDKKGFAFYQQICETAHKYGCKVCAQLHQTDTDMMSIIKCIPGMLMKKITPDQLRERMNDAVGPYITKMSQKKIHQIIAGFGKAAVLAKQAGFDMVQVHGDRMCGSFSSAIFNHRTDEYGGSAERRARFAVEAVKAVHAAVPGMAIDYKLAVRQENPHYGNAGVVEEELAVFVPLLVQAGVTSFHVTLANHSALENTIPPASHPEFRKRSIRSSRALARLLCWQSRRALTWCRCTATGCAAASLPPSSTTAPMNTAAVPSAAPALPWKLSRQCTPLCPAWPLTTSWLSGRRTPITATPVWWRRNWPCSCPCWCRQA